MGARRVDGYRAHLGASTDHTAQAAEQTGETSRNVASASPTWSGGAAIGFLSNTLDGTAFAFNLHADRFL